MKRDQSSKDKTPSALLSRNGQYKLKKSTITMMMNDVNVDLHQYLCSCVYVCAIQCNMLACEQRSCSSASAYERVLPVLPVGLKMASDSKPVGDKKFKKALKKLKK